MRGAKSVHGRAGSPCRPGTTRRAPHFLHQVNLESALIAVVCLMQASVVVVILSLLAVDYNRESNWVLHGNSACDGCTMPVLQRLWGRQSITREQWQTL